MAWKDICSNILIESKQTPLVKKVDCEKKYAEYEYSCNMVVCIYSECVEIITPDGVDRMKISEYNHIVYLINKICDESNTSVEE